MKKALKPSLQLSDGAVLTLGTELISALTGNAYFATPQPSVAQLQAAWDDYNTSLGKAKYGSRNDKSKKNTDKQTLLGLVRQEADYINTIANGDVDALSSCGLPLSKDREPKVLGTPEAKVEQGAAGELILSTPAVDGAVAYKHQYKPSESAAWSEISTSKATCIIGSLVEGTVYNLRIIAIGTKDQVTTSGVVTKMAA